MATVITAETVSGDKIHLNKDQVVFTQGIPESTPQYYHCLFSSGSFLDLKSDPLPIQQ